VAQINENKKERPLLIYLHIPKTGGTTLTQIICQQYQKNYHHPPGEAFHYNEQIRLANTLCGHLPFGAHYHIPRPFTYITLLRNPIEQVISWYYFRYKNPRYDQFDGDFDDYINSERFNYATVNLQTRFICGDDPPNLETAKRNLKNYFSVIGITELFDASLFFMKKELGWHKISYKNQNVNPNRPRNQFPSSIINKIKDKNEIDIQLYNFVKQMLEEKINNLDPTSKEEFALFKKSFLN